MSTFGTVPLGKQTLNMTLAAGGRVVVRRLRRSEINAVLCAVGYDASVPAKIRFAEYAARAAICKIEGVTDPYTGEAIAHRPEPHTSGVTLCGPEIIDAMSGDEISRASTYAQCGTLTEEQTKNSETPPGGSSAGGVSGPMSSTGSAAPGEPAPSAAGNVG